MNDKQYRMALFQAKPEGLLLSVGTSNALPIFSHTEDINTGLIDF
jgi:hypothetical protein